MMGTVQRKNERSKRQKSNDKWNSGAAHERQQRQRDDDAQLSSYWPNTLRVDTDMDSFWLKTKNGLIRPCQMIRAE
jgi:hypothetical protein